jgi:hypothetical protein
MALVGALTAGDFLLWNWSLSANHDVLALIAGVTLLPLAAASVLLAALTALQLASRFTRLPAIPAALRRAHRRQPPALREAAPADAEHAAGPSPKAARKLAA